MKREVGYAGNGKSLQLLASIGIHISVARFYAHDSPSREIAGLDRRQRVEGRATEVDTTYHCAASIQRYWEGEQLQTRAGSSEHIELTNTASFETRSACESQHLARLGVRIWHYAAKANEDYGFASEGLEACRVA